MAIDHENTDPFNDETQRKPIVQALKRNLWHKGRDPRFEKFWASDADRFVSLEALKSDADDITVVMTKDQWRTVLGWFPED